MEDNLIPGLLRLRDMWPGIREVASSDLGDGRY
jgi:hypothetical protein